MNLNEKLELLAMANGFSIREVSEGYEVENDRCELKAVITEEGYIEYYRSGVSGSIYDDAIIEVHELMRLKEFCEALVK